MTLTGEKRPLRQWIDPYRALTYGIVQAGPHVEDGIPYIRPADMTDAQGVRDEAGLLRTTPEIARSYARAAVAPDDVVMSIGPSFGKVMIVPRTLDGANLTQGTARLAPGAAIISKYLYWALQSEHSRQFWDSVVAGGTFRALNLGPLGETPIFVPAMADQQRTADFLDDQVARIDEIIRLREEQVALLSDRLGRRADALVAEAASHGWIRLKATAEFVTVGIVVTPSAWYADAGVPALRGTNVKPDSITLDDLVYLTPEGHLTHPKSQLRNGDVVVVRTGQAGAAAVVPPALDGANAIDILIVRPKRDAVPEFLAMSLNSPSLRERTTTTVVGAIQGHFNVSTLANAEIPAAPTAEQRRIAESWSVERRSTIELCDEMRSEIALLQERKRSLITAAVTGEFDVATASGRGVA
jgi:Restriction endonuclease S subunits